MGCTPRILIPRILMPRSPPHPALIPPFVLFRLPKSVIKAAAEAEAEAVRLASPLSADAPAFTMG